MPKRVDRDQEMLAWLKDEAIFDVEPDRAAMCKAIKRRMTALLKENEALQGLLALAE